MFKIKQYWTEETKQFYRRALMMAIPIMIQNGITNFVNMLDNVMVGQVGTDQMSGVAIVNQLVFVWNLMVFGGLSGIGIFTSQFHGKGDEKGVRYTFRLQMYLAAILLVIGELVFLFGDTSLITLYLHQDGGIGNVQATLASAESYLDVVMIGLLPFAITQVYSTVLKSTGETVVPMKASVAAVVINLIGNYVLIYGKFGAPALGVVGAAAATALSRYVEAIYIVYWTTRHKNRYPFIKGAFKSLYVPKQLIKNCAIKGTPLLVNETLWSGGQAALAQNYAVRGLSVVAAYNITTTISNVFNVAFIAMGAAIGIILGQELGKGNTKTVTRDAARLRYFSVLLCVMTSLLMIAFSGVFPHVYNTSLEIRTLAAEMIVITAICMPIDSYANALYFTLRSGGKTLITFLFDSCFSWVVYVPLAYFLVHHTDWSILPIYTTILLSQSIKCIIGYVMVRSGSWIHDITAYGGNK